MSGRKRRRKKNRKEREERNTMKANSHSQGCGSFVCLLVCLYVCFVVGVRSTKKK